MGSHIFHPVTPHSLQSLLVTYQLVNECIIETSLATLNSSFGLNGPLWPAVNINLQSPPKNLRLQQM
jgi:hypothetical protein